MAAARSAVTPSTWRSEPVHVRLAFWIGWLFHPFVVAVPVGIAGVVRELGLSPLRIAVLALSASAVTVGVPLLAILALYRAGAIGRDVLMLEARNRRFVYPVMLTGFAADAVLFDRILPFEIGRAMAWAAFGVTAALFLANFATKVSLHCAGLAGIVTGVICVYGARGLALAPLLPLVGWARVTTRNHTVAQALTGFALGALPVLLVVALGFPHLASR